MSLIEFFTENVWGIIILSVIGGVVGYFLSKALVLLFKIIDKKFRKKRHIKYLAEVGAVFGSGCKTEYALQKGSFHQILLMGDFIKDIVLIMGNILLVAILSLCFFVVFRDYWFSFPIIVTVASICIFFEYKRIKVCLRVFNEMFRYVYGEEYFKNEMEGIKVYWKKKTHE